MNTEKFGDDFAACHEVHEGDKRNLDEEVLEDVCQNAAFGVIASHLRNAEEGGLEYGCAGDVNVGCGSGP